MILIDANIFMYAAGAEHPHKRPSVDFLRRVASGEIEAAVDAEVLQEILHRYRSLGRWKQGSAVYDSTREIVPIVFAVTAEMTDVARSLLDEYAGLTARDALHAAVVQVGGLRGICSYDRHFDRISRFARIEPEAEGFADSGTQDRQ